MKKEFLLNLDSLTDLTAFVKEVSNDIPCDVNATYERQIVDAKSYLGLVSISTHPVKVNANKDDIHLLEKFARICTKYEVKENE